MLADRCEVRTKWEDMRAALAPWMMNVLWVAKPKDRMELEDLMVYNFVEAEIEKPKRTPEDASVALQNRVHNTMQMLAATAKSKG